MEGVKTKRTRPLLDMTPMVDLAFLLVTFFMLTTKFRPEEAVIVDTPSSVAEVSLPEKDIMTITVDKEGRIFFGVDSKQQREGLIRKMDEKYALQLNEAELQMFAQQPTMGMPLGGLKKFLAMEAEEKNRIWQPGIPADSAGNELADWIVFSRTLNPNLRIAIKADQQTGYPVVRSLIRTLQDNNINRFHLITNLEMKGT